MNKVSLRHLGVMLLLTLILAILYLYGRSLDVVEKRLIAPNLRNISADDARVNENVALLRTGLHNNYDQLNQLLQEIDVEIRRIETQLSATPFQNEKKLQGDLHLLRQQFEEKERLVEHFKSRNAVLRNTMMFIALTSSQISEKYGRYREVTNHTGRLTILLMKFYRSPDKAIIKDIQEQLTRLNQQATAPDVRLIVQQLKLHVNLAIDYVPEINRIMSAIATFSLREKAEVLMQDYLSLFAAQQARIKIFRWITYALSVLLLGYLSVILWRLQASRQALVDANRELVSEKDRATATLHSIGDGVMTLTHNGIVDYLNPVAERLTNWSLAEAQGLHVREVLHVLDTDSRQPLSDMAINALIRGGDSPVHGDTILRSRDGIEHSIQITASLISSEGAAQQGVVLVIRDITVTRHLIDRISHQAQHDALTGLVNRWEFERRLKNVLVERTGPDHFHALCYIDLDQFKVINDTCGHMAGDELLRQLSRALASRVRSADTLARLGGDEFGVLLVDCPLQRAMEIAEQLRQVVHEHEFLWEGNQFGVGASIGLVPLGPGDGDAQQVMTHADLACYAAKDMGRNRIHVYTTGDTALARRRQEMVWAGDIRHALAENRLRLYAQPIVPTVVGKLTPDHYEVLVRLLDATGREIMPEEFIPAAERFGVMSDVDRWVIASAFAWLAQREPSAMPIHLCINLSGTSLGETWLPAYIEESWRQYSLDARQICFEITETAAVTNLHDAVALMERLRGQGIQFALDDFGSGLSSFNYLKTLPVDYLKIDGSIVRNVVDDPIHRAMVEAINHVGHVMGKKTIAEFVENDSIRAELVKLGVDFVQGYGIGMPVPLSSLP